MSGLKLQRLGQIMEPEPGNPMEGIDRRDDLGQPNRFDVYYGMADNRIGAARLDLPDVLPPEGMADSPDDKV